MAMERIYKRISDDHPEISYGRDYWLHLHERKESLQLLDQRFRETLQVAQKKALFKIVEIDTRERGEEEVSRLISEFSLEYCQGHPFEKWEKI